MFAVRALTIALALALTPAFGADLPVRSDPSGAPSLAPATITPDWSGFFVGSGVSASFAKGAKGAFGGEAFAGYDHRFDNNLVLGLRGTTGYAPLLAPGGSFNGLSYGAIEAKLGYDMGRLTPYVVAGAGASRWTRWGGGLASPADNVNSLFSGPGAAQPVGTVGVGATYAITNNVRVGVEARVVNNGAPFGF